MGSMSHVDDPIYVSGEYTEEQKAEVVKHGERIIEAAGEEFKAVFLQEYKQLMQKVPILSFRPVLYLMLWTVTYSSVLDYKPLKRMIWNYFQRH